MDVGERVCTTAGKLGQGSRETVGTERGGDPDGGKRRVLEQGAHTSGDDPIPLSNRKAQTLRAPLTPMMRAMPTVNHGSDAGGRHSATSSKTCPAAKRPKIVPVVKR